MAIERYSMALQVVERERMFRGIPRRPDLPGWNVHRKEIDPYPFTLIGVALPNVWLAKNGQVMKN